MSARDQLLARARWLTLLARLGLSGLFLYAGLVKLADPGSLVQDLSNYRVLPDSVAPVLALGLPVLELVTALALLTPMYAQGGAALSALMLLVFAAAMTQAKLRGIDLDCGCFGPGTESKVSWAKVALNLGLAILALWIAARPAPAIAAPPPEAAPS